MASQKVMKVMDFKGLIAAPFTPFHQNGEVNLDLIPSYVELLVKNGVKGVFVHGTTGEGLSLTVAERKAIAEQWVKHGKNKLELIILQIAATCVKDVQDMAAHAEKIGASAIATLPPIYFRPDTPVQLISYLKTVHDAAPSMPLMLYHFPDMVQLKFKLSEVLVGARLAIPTFVGAKFTSLDMRDLQKCHRLPGHQFKLISGYDEAVLPSMDCGVTATIGSSYNFMAPLVLRVVEAREKGDYKKAMEYQQHVAEIAEVIGKYGQIFAALKAVMNIVSPLNMGPSRAPLVPLSPQELESLKKDLERLGSATWMKH